MSGLGGRPRSKKAVVLLGTRDDNVPHLRGYSQMVTKFGSGRMGKEREVDFHE